MKKQTRSGKEEKKERGEVGTRSGNKCNTTWPQKDCQQMHVCSSKNRKVSVVQVAAVLGKDTYRYSRAANSSSYHHILSVTPFQVRQSPKGIQSCF